MYTFLNLISLLFGIISIKLTTSLSYYISRPGKTCKENLWVDDHTTIDECSNTARTESLKSSSLCYGNTEFFFNQAASAQCWCCKNTCVGDHCYNDSHLDTLEYAVSLSRPSKAPSISISPSLLPSLDRFPSSYPTLSISPSFSPSKIKFYISKLGGTCKHNLWVDDHTTLEACAATAKAESLKQSSACYGGNEFFFNEPASAQCWCCKNTCTNNDCYNENTALNVYAYGDVSLTPSSSFLSFPSNTPSLNPSLSPAPSFASSMDEWTLKFEDAVVGDGDNSALQELSFLYKISKGKSASQLKISLLDETCTNIIEEDSIAITGKEIQIVSSGILDEASISIDIDESSIVDSAYWHSDSDTSGTIRFCARTELFLSDDSFSVTFTETKVFMNIDFSSGFEIKDISLDKEEASQIDEDVTFDITSCICDKADSSCIESSTLKQNSEFSICVKPVNDLIEISTFESLLFFQDGQEKYAPIENGVSDELTESVTGSVGVVNARMISLFFFEDPPSQVTISGKVLMNFMDSSSRSLLDRSRGVVQDAESATFDVLVSLQSSADIASSDKVTDSKDPNITIIAGVAIGVFVLVSAASMKVYYHK